VLGNGPTGYVRGLSLLVCGRGRLVDLHPSLA
jgi:hypothetical protein